MRQSILIFGLFLLGMNGRVDSSDIKSSLAFVIDDTGSMGDDIEEVKKDANEIFDTVMNSKSSQIEDFVLVTFNDPTTKRRTKTKDRKVFKDALDTIDVNGGDDCPEMAMSGIQLALQNSREGSSLYVFTDASAKDYEKYDEVVALSQKMGCQIVFVLTGICYSYGGRKAPHYLVYKKLAEATNGQVFHLQKSEIAEVLEYVKLNIESRKNVLTSKTFPSGHGAFDVTVDADMKELVISVSGKSPSISVTDSGGTKWPTTDVTRLSEIAVVKVVGVTPDVYTVEVDSTDEAYVKVEASTSVHFQHGFSTVSPSAITDTVRQPVPGEKSHLSIKLSTEGTDVELRSVQILDMNDDVILEAPLKLVDKAEQFYTTEQITPPGHLFKVAIKGYDVKTKTFLTRISLTPIQPQEFKRDTVETKAPVVACKTEVTVAYDKPLQLKCRVNGWPKPNVIWQSDVTSAPLSHFESTVELPYDYVSVVEVPHVNKNGTYTCKAVNSEGEGSARILVHTKQPKYFKTVATPKDVTIEYQKSVVIPCKVEAYPPATVTWYKGGHVLRPDANIQLSADGSALTIRSMQPYIADNYICEARNLVGRRLFRFKVDISGVEAPEIDNTITSIKAVKNSRADIQCPILKGIPIPTIYWYYKEFAASEFIRLDGISDTIHLGNVDTTNAGSYRCIAENIIDSDYHEIDLIVEYEPSIPKHFKSTVTLNEGDTVILRCPAVGAPVPKVTWKFKGVAVRSIGRHSIFADGTLRFSAISSDEGEYECEARNPLGVARINIKLNVNVLPVLESPKTSFIEQMEGFPVTLPCRADGSPKPRLTWVYRSNDSTLGPRKYAPSDATGTLRFDSILLQQSGEYICVAANSRGSRNITYSVSVLAPPTIHYTTKKFEAVVDDMQLRIPCNNTGNPKPEITWTYEGHNIASGSEWFTIGEDGSLTIKNINKESQEIYTCRAFNKYGRTEEDFNVTILDSPNPGFLSNEIQLEEGTSAIIPCSVPQQKTDRLRWFRDGKVVSSSVLELRGVMELDAGTYTCRVSSVDRPAQTGSTKVEVGFKPRFTYDDDKNIPFVLGESALMDCTASGVPEPEVKWYHDGTEISFNEFKYELEMNDNNDRGRYKCVVGNKYGTVQQEFVISSFECLLDVTHLNGNEPLLLTPYDKLTNFKTSDGFVHIPKDEVVKFACPSSFDTIRTREIVLTCENEQLFMQPSSGRRYLYSDLKCRDKWQPIVKSTGRRCIKGDSEMFSVGFEIKTTFQEVYVVCVDKVSKNPIYTKLNMQPSLANVVAHNDTEWFDGGSPVDLDSLYDCSNQNAEITSILNKEFHRDGCCFAKRMLVNPRDVAAGMPQAATYTHLNVAPHWSTCNSKNWEDVERRIRNLVTSSNRPLQVWTGTAEDLQLPDGSYEQKKVVIRSSGRNVQVPKYLWKVVQDPYTKASLAIVQVNVPDLKLADVRRYRLCNDVCKEAEWMRSGRWRNVNQGYTYCCSLRDFERAFRFYAAFPSYDKLLLELSDIPDDHYLHAI